MAADILMISDAKENGHTFLTLEGKSFSVSNIDGRGALTFSVYQYDETGSGRKIGGAISFDLACRIAQRQADGMAVKEAQAFRDWVDRAVEKADAKVRAKAEALGFSVWSLGGGCLGWGRQLFDGTTVTFSNDSELDGPDTDENGKPLWDIMREDSENEGWVSVSIASLDELDEAFELLSSLESVAGQEIIYPSLDAMKASEPSWSLPLGRGGAAPC